MNLLSGQEANSDPEHRTSGGMVWKEIVTQCRPAFLHGRLWPSGDDSRLLQHWTNWACRFGNRRRAHRRPFHAARKMIAARHRKRGRNDKELRIELRMLPRAARVMASTSMRNLARLLHHFQHFGKRSKCRGYAQVYKRNQQPGGNESSSHSQPA